MRVPESCAACLYDRQKNLLDDPSWLQAVKDMISRRKEDDTAPYLIWQFGQEYEKRFGKRPSCQNIRKKCSSLVLPLREAVRDSILAAEDPLKTALGYARTGNYIDFAAMDSIDAEEFITLLKKASLREDEEETYLCFRRQCEKADTFLLIADNCGEIILDALFLEQLKKINPSLRITVMVRGGEVLNDATEEDAREAGLEAYAKIITTNAAAAGVIVSMLDADGKKALDTSDVILAKGQGNCESLSHQGRHIFYAFLCKCELFTERFHVPRFSGIFTEEI